MTEHTATQIEVAELMGRVLQEHDLSYERRVYPSWTCSCGWDGRDNDTQMAAHMHVGEQLAAALTQRMTQTAPEPSETEEQQ